MALGLDNLSLPHRLLIAGGVRATRRYLQLAGMRQGLELTPVHSRLVTEIGMLATAGKFRNEVDDQPLVGSLAMSFAPWALRIRTRQQVGERLLMPPVRQSVPVMRRLQKQVNSGQPQAKRLYANLYSEVLEQGETFHDGNAPFDRAQVITPDLARKRGYMTVGHMITGLRGDGIEHFTVGTLHSVMPAQDDPTHYLQDWRSWMPDLVRSGDVGQISVSFARGDLKPAGDPTHRATFGAAHSILTGNAEGPHMAALSEQLQAIGAAAAELPHPPLVVIHARAANLHDIQPDLAPHEAHGLLGSYVVSQLTAGAAAA